jgi:hypothetical protein
MFFPSRKQLNSWNLPSKITYYSFLIAIFSFIFFFILFLLSNKKYDNNEMNSIAEIIIEKILDGSTLCCDIKTAEVIVYMPQEKAIRINASQLIGEFPDSIKRNSLTFAYSTNKRDSIKKFDCLFVGKKNIDVYFFDNGKLFCSKPAILDFRDPDDFCNDGI